MRIRMPHGHVELSLEGHRYTPDNLGAFEVPDQYFPELARVHGAVREAGIQDFEQAVEEAEASVSAIKALLERRTNDLKVARTNLENARAKAKVDAENRAQAVEDAKKSAAAADADSATVDAKKVKKQ